MRRLRLADKSIWLQEESFHLVDNRPVKTNKFGGGRRFQQNNRFNNQQRRDGKDGARGGPEQDKKKGGAQQQKKQQFYGRDNNRVSIGRARRGLPGSFGRCWSAQMLHKAYTEAKRV